MPAHIIPRDLPEGMPPMKIAIEISGDDAQLVQAFVDGTADDANTHGKLTIETLAAMLLEDVALAMRRTGSWEGHNMSEVLISHGYEP
jgi:hypothetical protein